MPHNQKTGGSVSFYTAQTAYENFEEFSGAVRKSRVYWNSETVATIALERLARNSPVVAKKVFESACVQPMLDILLKGEMHISEISPDGKLWIQSAIDRFAQEPGWSMGVLEGILVLELVEPWAERNVRDWSGGKTTLAKFRQKPISDGVTGWMEKIYQGAYSMSGAALSSYAQIRAVRVALTLAAIIDGVPITNEEIKLASACRPAPGISADGHVVMPDELITNAKEVVKYVLGESHLHF